jgi:hypothetical protein
MHMRLLAIAALALGAAWPLGVCSAAPTTGQSVTNGPNGDPGVWWRFVANGPDTAPVVWWQFVTNGPNGERQVSPHFADEEECERALKAVEALLAKRFPHRYPLVGSCEPYR